MARLRISDSERRSGAGAPCTRAHHQLVCGVSAVDRAAGARDSSLAEFAHANRICEGIDTDAARGSTRLGTLEFPRYNRTWLFPVPPSNGPPGRDRRPESPGDRPGTAARARTAGTRAHARAWPVARAGSPALSRADAHAAAGHAEGTSHAGRIHRRLARVELRCPGKGGCSAELTIHLRSDCYNHVKRRWNRPALHVRQSTDEPLYSSARQRGYAPQKSRC